MPPGGAACPVSSFQNASAAQPTACLPACAAPAGSPAHRSIYKYLVVSYTTVPEPPSAPIVYLDENPPPVPVTMLYMPPLLLNISLGPALQLEGSTQLTLDSSMLLTAEGWRSPTTDPAKQQLDDLLKSLANSHGTTVVFHGTLVGVGGDPRACSSRWRQCRAHDTLYVLLRPRPMRALPCIAAIAACAASCAVAHVVAAALVVHVAATYNALHAPIPCMHA